MKMKLTMGSCVVGALVASGVALAHHGWGDYDAAKMFTIASPVEAVTPGNPHVTVRLKHENKVWVAVLAPPSRMTSRGMPPETIKAGAEIKLEGYPKRTGEPEMRAERITMAGKTIELR